MDIQELLYTFARQSKCYMEDYPHLDNNNRLGCIDFVVIVVILLIFGVKFASSYMEEETKAYYSNLLDIDSLKSKLTPDFKNIPKPVRLYRFAAERGDTAAMVYLGDCYWRGKGVKANRSEAAKWYLRAAEKGHVRAQFIMGGCYSLGIGVEKDDREAAKWLLRAAESGFAEAQFMMGGFYLLGIGVEKDPQESKKWFLEAEKQGYVVDQSSSDLRPLPRLKPVDTDKEAAERGDAQAQYNMGLSYFTRKNNQKREDYQEAQKWFQKSANQGYAPAQYYMGLYHEMGYAGNPNDKEAVKWYRKAAEQGHAQAQTSLAACYEYGFGVDKNKDMAREWYQKAADQGELEAQSALKRMQD